MSYLRTLNETDVDPSRFGVDSDLLQLLMEIGVLGVARSYFAQASKVFEALRVVTPTKAEPLIGYGILALARKDLDGAISILLNGALDVNPDSDTAKTLLGLALKDKGMMKEAETMLNEVVEIGKDEAAKQLAGDLLKEYFNKK